jgi:hypothetical protein
VVVLFEGRLDGPGGAGPFLVGRIFGERRERSVSDMDFRRVLVLLFFRLMRISFMAGVSALEP